MDLRLAALGSHLTAAAPLPPGWCPTRDGRDVVDSMVDAQMPGGWLAHPGAGRAEGLRDERLALVRREPCKRRGRVGGQL